MNESDYHIYDEIHDNYVSNGTNKVEISGTSSNAPNKVAVSPNSMLNELHERTDDSHLYINDGFRSTPERNTKQSSERKINKLNRMFSSPAAFFFVET